MDVQIFGSSKSKEAQKALRFFKERGLKPHYVDLNKRDISPGELTRFAQKFGLQALVARASKAYEQSGLEYLRLSDAELKEKLAAEPALLVQPLIRSGKTLALGWDEAFWREVYASAKTGGS